MVFEELEEFRAYIKALKLTVPDLSFAILKEMEKEPMEEEDEELILCWEQANSIQSASSSVASVRVCLFYDNTKTIETPALSTLDDCFSKNNYKEIKTFLKRNISL